MCEFESSEVSQAVRRLETLPSVTSEMPANGGLLRIGYRSPGSQIGRCGSEIADSLRRIFEIFPFLGDSDRRPSSIGTAWRMRQSDQAFKWQLLRKVTGRSWLGDPSQRSSGFHPPSTQNAALCASSAEPFPSLGSRDKPAQNADGVQWQ